MLTFCKTENVCVFYKTNEHQVLLIVMIGSSNLVQTVNTGAGTRGFLVFVITS